MSRKRSSIYRMLEPQKKTSKDAAPFEKTMKQKQRDKNIETEGTYIKSELLKYSISSLVLLFAVLHAHLTML